MPKFSHITIPKCNNCKDMSENRTVAACYSIASTYILLETTKIKPCYAHLVLWEFKIFGKKIQTSASGSSNDHSHQICL